ANQEYVVRVDYYENGGGALASLEWQSSSQPRQVIPSSRLLPPNQSPVLTVKSPVGGAIIAQSAAVNIDVDAIDPDGDVKVQYSVDNVQLAELTTPPFTWPWPNPSLGGHDIMVRAVDNSGASVFSSFSVTIVPTFNLNARF